jgi:hypothetical protein
VPRYLDVCFSNFKGVAMSDIIHGAMTFALSSSGRMNHINDVPNGARCGCICPQCERALIAKNGGQERAHHFAHKGGAECESGAETALHLAAKQVVADHKRLVLPFSSENSDGQRVRYVEFNTVYLEHVMQLPSTQQRIIADCFGEGGDGPFLVEIAVHHKVESEKAAVIDNLGLPAIEICLSDLIGKTFGWDELRNAVLFETFRRHWISAPLLEQGAPMVESVAAPEQLSTPPRPKEWCIAIGQTWIWVREFQSGDLRVFHRYDQRVREVIEPMCRKRGYWNAKYKNWIVFKQFKPELLDLLGRQGHVVHAPVSL